MDAKPLAGELYTRASVPARDVITFLQNLVEQGDDSKAGLLGYLFSGVAEGVPRDAREAARYTRRGAEAGATICCVVVAARCASGTLKCGYGRAEQAGAMARLGHLYAASSPHVEAEPVHDGGNATLASAVRWLQKARAKDPANASALLGLGYMALHGIGMQRNATRAFRYLRTASLLKSVDADATETRYQLGLLWLRGQGVSRPDPRQAQRLWLEAAKVCTPRLQRSARPVLSLRLRSGACVRSDAGPRRR